MILTPEDNPAERHEDRAALLVLRVFTRHGREVVTRITTVDDTAVPQEETTTVSDPADAVSRVQSWLLATVQSFRRDRPDH